MDQFRQIGEALGAMKALMVFQKDIQINHRQCSFLLDSLTVAYETIAEEMKNNLRFEDQTTKWKILEQPLRELYRVYRESEAYIRQCFESKYWWSKAIYLYQNRDCVEFHVHNLLCCILMVIEAIEIAGELSSSDEDHVLKRRLFWSRKYHNDWNDPKLFQWKFSRQYLVSSEYCARMDVIWKEDRWILLDKLREKRSSGSTKYEQKLIHLLLKNLDHTQTSDTKLLPCQILVSSKDYQVRRRLGNGSQYKEISWLGESYVLRHLKGDIGPLIPEISQLLSLSHPNILQFLCGFIDDDKKECFLITELMSRNLSTHMKEHGGIRKRISPFSLPVAVDIMLQIARGLEYLHSKQIYHGDLNPSNILVKARTSTGEGFFHAKVSRFGLSSVIDPSQTSGNPNEIPSFIWHAPEVLAEQEGPGNAVASKYTAKNDIYSFGMICFEMLTGKVPFEDSHLQGDKMSRNIRAGERPLFPFHCPKYVVNLTKKCWHSDPNQRPSFSSICRILRYIKRFLVMNLDQHTEPLIPLVDYYDIETTFLRKFPSWRKNDVFPVSEVPFQMFSYRIIEKEKSISHFKDTSESGSEGASVSEDENAPTAIDDPFPTFIDKKNMVTPEVLHKRLSLVRKSADSKTTKYPGTPKARSARPPQLSRSSRSLNVSIAKQMLLMSPRVRRHSGHSSDSELS